MDDIDFKKTTKYSFNKINSYLWPCIRFAIDCRLFLSKISCSSRTASTCSGFDRFGTCKVDVNADSISISSSTSLITKKKMYKPLVLIVFSQINGEFRVEEKNYIPTYLRLLVHKINNFRPFGGSFFSKTSKACNVKFEYRGPIGP